MIAQPSLERILNFRFRNDLLPIFLAPMAGVVGLRLASAVTAAGGYAILPVSWCDPREIRRQIRALIREGTRNFAVSLSLRQDQWARLFCSLEEGVATVHFSKGDAASYVATVQELGARVIQTVSDTDQAKRALDAGVDILVVQGRQPDGLVHGDIAGSILLSSIVEFAGSVPVIFSGGFVDGRGIAAAACLGLSGAMLSGRFIPCLESDAHELYKKAVSEYHLSGGNISKNPKFGGWENSSQDTFIKNMDKATLDAGYHAPGHRKNTARFVGQYAKRDLIQNNQSCRDKGAWEKNDTYKSLMRAGQRVELIGHEPTAGTCMAELTAEYCQALKRIIN